MVRSVATLCLLLLPSLAIAQDMPLELVQRQVAEQAGQEDGPKPASAMFTNLSLGRAGHASWSLLVPGWSQYRAGNSGRALLFASIEATIWSVFAVSKVQESSREDTYHDFAENFAGVSSTDHADAYWSAVGKYKDSDEYNERVRRENRAAAEEQAFNGEPVTIGINDGTVSAADAWFWTSGTRLLEYRELRADAQSASDRAEAMIFFAVVNRLVSFIEAFRSGPADNQVELYQAGGFELSVQVDPNPLRPSGALVLGRGF